MIDFRPVLAYTMCSINVGCYLVIHFLNWNQIMDVQNFFWKIEVILKNSMALNKSFGYTPSLGASAFLGYAFHKSIGAI